MPSRSAAAAVPTRGNQHLLQVFTLGRAQIVRQRGDRPRGRGAGRARGELRAVVTLPTSGSIQQQLLQLRVTNRELPLDALLPRAMIQRRTIVEDQCPQFVPGSAHLPRPGSLCQIPTTSGSIQQSTVLSSKRAVLRSMPGLSMRMMPLCDGRRTR